MKNNKFLYYFTKNNFPIIKHSGFTHYPTEWQHFYYKDRQKFPVMHLFIE